MAGLGRKVWANETLSQPDLQGYLQDQTVMVFATSAARTAAIAAPTEGMVSYLQSTKTLEMHDGTAWGPLRSTLVYDASSMLQSGWTQYDSGGTYGETIRGWRDVSGLCHLQGAFTNTGAVSIGAVVTPLVIPTIMRPVVNCLRAVRAAPGGPSLPPVWHRIDVLTTGNVTVNAGSAVAAAAAWVLDLTWRTTNL